MFESIHVKPRLALACLFFFLQPPQSTFYRVSALASEPVVMGTNGCCHGGDNEDYDFSVDVNYGRVNNIDIEDDDDKGDNDSDDDDGGDDDDDGGDDEDDRGRAG